jgi:uncharacterized protein YjgD (DUF1641 family)
MPIYELRQMARAVNIDKPVYLERAELIDKLVAFYHPADNFKIIESHVESDQLRELYVKLFLDYTKLKDLIEN